MTITSMDTLVEGLIRFPQEWLKDASTAEAAGIRHSLWYSTGNPGAGSAPGGGLNGATFTSPVTGQIPVPATNSPETIYVARADAYQAANVAFLEIYDRLWGNVPVVTTTGAQAITSPTWPARSSDGSTQGADVRLFLEVSSTTGNAGAITNTTCSYTSSVGTAGRTATVTSFPATGQTGTLVPFNLQAGDTGARSVQSITLGTSYVSGAVHLLAARLIARIPLPQAYVPTALDFTALGLPAIWDGAVLFAAVMPTGTAVGAVGGNVGYAQG